MKIDLDWIQEELDAGREVELECVDITGFLENIYTSEDNEKILDQGLSMVDCIDSDGDIRLVSHIEDFYFNVIASEEFKYFRIKRNEPTFDDLIDVAVKAVKNRALFTISIGDIKRKGRYLNYAVNGNSPTESFYESDDDYQACIDFIKSLYTETFVIESEKDMLRIKSNAEITLANGEKITSAGIINNLLSYFSSNEDGEATRNNYVGFTFIKGATATQKKGNK